MTNKEKCSALMLKFFGPASARTVEDMSEDECIKICRGKVSALMGEERAKEFDKF